MVMSSGSDRASVFQAPVPFGRNLWCSFLPKAICRTVSVCDPCVAALALGCWAAGCPALAGSARAAAVAMAPADATAAVSSLAVRLL